MIKHFLKAGKCGEVEYISGVRTLEGFARIVYYITQYSILNVIHLLKFKIVYATL